MNDGIFSSDRTSFTSYGYVFRIYVTNTGRNHGFSHNKGLHASKIKIYVNKRSKHSISFVPNGEHIKWIWLLLKAELCWQG